MTNRSSRRWSIAAGMGAALVAACSAQIFAEVTIQYWNVWDNEKPYIARFNEQFKGQIHVEAVAGGEDKLPVAVAGGAPPDLIKIDRFRSGSDAAHGLLTPLDALVKADNINANAFWPAVWNECTYKNQVVCMPWNTDARALFYNKEVFAASGLDPNGPPRTWSEAIAMGNKMDRQDASGKFTQIGFNPNQGNWFYLGWLWAAGGDLLDSTDRKVIWNSDAGLEAATFMEDRIKHYGSNLAGGMGQLKNGTTGMVMEGSWNIGDLVHVDKDSVKWFAAGAPAPDGMAGQATTWSGGFALGIPVGAKHPKEAWTFMKWWAENAQQVDFAADTGQIPATLSAAHDMKFYSLNNLIPVFVKIMANSHFRPVIPAGNELWGIYTDQIDSLITQAKLPPKQILDQTAQLGQKALDDGWAIAEGKKKVEVVTYGPVPTSKTYATVDIAKIFNNVGITTLQDTKDGSLDSGGATLAAEGLPEGGKVQTIADVPFIFPKAGVPDNFSSDGSEIKVPAGNYNGIYFLATGTNGSPKGDATLVYTDGSTKSVPFGISDWCSGTGNYNEKPGPKPDHRHNAAGNTTPACGMWVQGLSVDAGKQLEGVKLPLDPKIHIFAVTVGSN